jgi:putative endonuclease
MEMRRSYWVYILANDIGGTLYVGVTNDLVRRVHEHRVGAVEGFTRQNSIHRLVYFEPYDQIELAIRREKQLKKWNRAWKVSLIERENPHWSDLYPTLAGQ